MVIVAKSLQMITYEVVLPEAIDCIMISVVYASNDAETRKELWEEIVDLASSVAVVDKS